MNGLIKFALGVAGLPPATVADIEKQLPGAARLVEAAKQFEPFLEQAHPHIEAITPHLAAMAPHVIAALPHLQALLPILDKALPILKAEYPDIIALLPTAQEIIAFIGEKKTAATAPIVSDPSRLGSG